MSKLRQVVNTTDCDCVQENDSPNGDTPPEVEQLLAPPTGAVSDEDLGRRQEGRSEKDVKEEEAEEKREGEANCSAGRKRGKDGGAGGAGNAAAIETIQKLLLMIPVDLEKLRNLAWEKGGYQVRQEKRDIEVFIYCFVFVSCCLFWFCFV